MTSTAPVPALAAGEFDLDTTYLDTASYGIPPARAFAAVREVLDGWASGHRAPSRYDDRVDRLRAAHGRLLGGANPEDVAIGSSVGGLIGPAAAALPPGAEVLVAAGDFASVPNPFRYRGDLRVRTVPVADLAREVRPDTALVACSLVQSADGRTVDPTELRAATRAHDALLLFDVSQAAGWLPLRFADADIWVCAGFKWLLGARSVALLAMRPEIAERLRPQSPGWYAAADRWAEMYAPQRLADTVRRFDATPDWLGVVGALAGAELLEELTVEAVHAHDLALANRFRAGLAELGLSAVPGNAPIVSLPGAAAAAETLAAAGIVTTARAGALRVSFHLHNDSDDVDRALKALGDSEIRPATGSSLPGPGN
ncbi:aminotransferase class V-fold PLP-dependent enzyme [Nocardia veterana]|uniref:Aminotransferase class V-fold PLP-dependent enzyme n=1 Tax=Nocardia veterana TaxID=132249 RepID=A0A7X6M0T7_9NOCA|nr:aminotransferase class V-fold PLP-dependent enzyme [Nocardia veterana]NKY87267.1 aminotransferase class V-fold PLP-dependent enzyme [Nocardia veterana]